MTPVGVHWEGEAEAARREEQLAERGVAWFPPAPRAVQGALFAATDPYQGKLPRKRWPEPMSRSDADLEPAPPPVAAPSRRMARRGEPAMNAEAASAAANCPYVAFYAQTAGAHATRDRGDELWNPAKWGAASRG